MKHYQVAACLAEFAPAKRPAYDYIAALGYRGLDSVRARRQHAKAVRRSRLRSHDTTPRVKSGQLLGLPRSNAL